MLPITLDDQVVAELAKRAHEIAGYELTVDLDRLTLSDTQGLSVPFVVSEFQRYCLLEGLDDIGLTLRHESDIKTFEASRPAWKVSTSI